MNITLNEFELLELLTYVPEHIIQNEVNELYDKKDLDVIVWFFLGIYNKIVFLSGANEELAVITAARFLIHYYEYEYEVLIEDALAYNKKCDEYETPFDSGDLITLQKIIKRARELTI